MCIRRGGPSELWRDSVAMREIVVEWFTAMLVCTPIHGPAQIASSLIQVSVSGQHHSLRGSKSLTYHLWGVSCMLPHLPLKLLYLHFHPYPPFCHHLTPLCARICQVERALPPSSVPQKSIIPNPGNCQTCTLNSWRNQGECC